MTLHSSDDSPLLLPTRATTTTTTTLNNSNQHQYTAVGEDDGLESPGLHQLSDSDDEDNSHPTIATAPPSYQPVPTQNPVNPINTTNYNQQQGSNSTLHRTTGPQAPLDGVFANLPAKPTIKSASAAVEPPSYDTISPGAAAAATFFDTTSPPHYYLDGHDNSAMMMMPTHIPVVDEDGDVVLHGLPVGTLFLFFANLFISASFDFMGYLLTSIFATTHAAKYGSLSGLGLTLMRLGLVLSIPGASLSDWDSMTPSSALDADDEPWGSGDANLAGNTTAAPVNGTNSTTPHRSVIVGGGGGGHINLFSWFLMSIGFWLMVSANTQFLAVYRMKSVILSASIASGAVLAAHHMQLL